jgi:hypothetical protein
LHPARHQQPRKRLARREPEERIVLVVAEDDVVARPVLAHQVGLEHQGLELVVGDDVVEVGDLAHERVGLGVVRARLLEVRADPAPQRGRLADVDHLRLGVAVEVDARPVGKPLQLVLEAHTAIVATARGRVDAPEGARGRATSPAGA